VGGSGERRGRVGDGAERIAEGEHSTADAGTTREGSSPESAKGIEMSEPATNNVAPIRSVEPDYGSMMERTRCDTRSRRGGSLMPNREFATSETHLRRP
jgi:hypothetical protein